MMPNKKRWGLFSYIKSEVHDVFAQLKIELSQDEELPNYSKTNQELESHVDGLREKMKKKIDDGDITLEQLSKFALKKLKNQ